MAVINKRVLIMRPSLFRLIYKDVAF